MCWWIFGHCWHKKNGTRNEEHYGKSYMINHIYFECCKCGRKTNYIPKVSYLEDLPTYNFITSGSPNVGRND